MRPRPYAICCIGGRGTIVPPAIAVDATREDSSLMAEFEDFHRDFLPRFIEAQRAFHDGNADPNIALWSTTDPVTLFAARGLCDSGTGPVTKTFRRVASEFSDVRDYGWEFFASRVSGDLAYTVAIEHYMASTRGGPQALTELRVTHVFSREDGEWRTVHRHADRKPADQRHAT